MIRKPLKSKSLAIINSDLASEWHPTKNGDLTPFDVTAGSSKRVWWKCIVANDHEWSARIIDRVRRGDGCTICSGRKVVKSNCLATTNPELAKEWHPDLNGKKNPFNVTSGANIKIWWKCSKNENHIWKASIGNRALKSNGCPFCSGHKILKATSLEVIRPDLMKFWDYTKNKQISPNKIGPNSSINVWWKCKINIDHVWKSSPNKVNKCPFCTGQKVTNSNCLATTNPKLAKEWHPNLNGNKNPFNVTRGSDKRYWWKCSKNEDHVWRASINSRTSNMTSCPYCKLPHQSKQELTIGFELMLFFDLDPKGFKTRINDKIWSIDIYVKELHLGIEFDGSYWHKGKRELDKLKTKKLEKDGFKIIRVRQEPLKKITDIDVISKEPFNAKEVTNNILKHILDAYNLDSKRIHKIENYLRKKEIQNEKALETYIEKVLNERSNK